MAIFDNMSAMTEPRRRIVAIYTLSFARRGLARWLIFANVMSVSCQLFERDQHIPKAWVCLKMVSTPKPNGFADHYPY